MKNPNEKLNEAFANIDSAYIEKAATPPKRKRNSIIATLLIAALLTGTVLSISFFQKSAQNRHEPNYIDLSTILLIDDTSLAQKTYTAKQIGDALKDDNKNDSVGTKAYTKFYVPNASYLNLVSPPEGDWITIFESPTDILEPSKKEKVKFFNNILSRAKEKLNIPLSMTVTEQQISNKSLRWETDKFIIFAGFTTEYSYISMNLRDHFHQIKLNGNVISVDQTQNDDEIIASLDSIRTGLCEMMGTNLADTKIVREYDFYSEYGVTRLDVYFYNKNDHPANELSDTAPQSDYIKLSFDNTVNWADDYVSDKILTNLYIQFVKYHKSSTYPVRAKMISLEKAEEMLKKGYVFGFHICELCMQEQSPVDFSDYEYVSLVYKSTNDKRLLPFYAFYKVLGEARNGNNIYALTYVPAFEISGLEEYFKEQTANHKDSPFG